MSDLNEYWWSQYGNFPPGVDNYPHIGEVISYYRIKRGFRTQQDFAIALGCSKRHVEDLEGSMNMDTPDSVTRRMVLAKLLKIPPALLALDWHFLLDQADTTSTGIGKSLRETTSRTGADTEVFNLYQDMLVIGWECTFKGGQKTAHSIDRRLEALVHIANTASVLEQEQWLSLLCRFYQLSTRLAQRRMDTQRSLRDAQEAIDTATQLNDAELLASAFFWRSRLNLEQGHLR